jgi:hypothetical protein
VINSYFYFSSSRRAARGKNSFFHRRQRQNMSSDEYVEFHFLPSFAFRIWMRMVQKYIIQNSSFAYQKAVSETAKP